MTDYKKLRDAEYDSNKVYEILKGKPKPKAPEFSTDNEQAQYILDSIQAIRKHQNSTDGVHTLNTMMKYSTDDRREMDSTKAVDFGTQPQISLFNSDQLGKVPFSTVSLEDIVEYVRMPPMVNSGIGDQVIWSTSFKNDVAQFGYKRAVTWAGEMSKGRKEGKPIKLSGLVCIGLFGLTSAQIQLYLTTLKKDPFSHVVFRYELEDGLKIIVKAECISDHDYDLQWRQLMEYYHKYYGIQQQDFSFPYGRPYELCYLPSGTDVHFNASSRRLLSVVKQRRESALEYLANLKAHNIK